MATRLYVTFVSNAALATAFGTTEAALVAVERAEQAFNATMYATDDSAGDDAYRALRDASAITGPASSFLSYGDGFGSITARAYDRAVALGICAANDYVGTTTDRAAMRELVALQADKAQGYEVRGFFTDADAYRATVNTVLAAINAGTVVDVGFY